MSVSRIIECVMPRCLTKGIRRSTSGNTARKKINAGVIVVFVSFVLPLASR